MENPSCFHNFVISSIHCHVFSMEIPCFIPPYPTDPMALWHDRWSWPRCRATWPFAWMWRCPACAIDWASVRVGWRVHELGWDEDGGYPLVTIDTTMEKHLFQWENSLFDHSGGFIAMNQPKMVIWRSHEQFETTGYLDVSHESVQWATTISKKQFLRDLSNLIDIQLYSNHMYDYIYTHIDIVCVYVYIYIYNTYTLFWATYSTGMSPDDLLKIVFQAFFPPDRKRIHPWFSWHVNGNFRIGKWRYVSTI